MSEDHVAGSGLRFDLSVNLGQVLTATAMILSVVAAYFAIRSDIRDHEGRIARVEQSVINQDVLNQKAGDSLGSIKTDIAVIRDRLERASSERQDMIRSLTPREVPPRP